MTTALVLGLGETGLAMARRAARDGDAVRVWDSRAQPPNEARLAETVPDAVLIAPRGLDASDLAGVDRVLKSPGLAPRDPAIAALLEAARAAGVPVQGELDLFAAALETLRREADYAPKVVAVTGTNGKTTTTALLALLAARSGKRVAAAGNIGPTMLQTLADAVDAGPPETLLQRLPEVWVLELSSFQLADAAGVDADAAALLNLSEDHLDWHGDMAAYAAAKAKVFGARATIVVDRDDASASRLAAAAAVATGTGARKAKPSTPPRRRASKAAPRRVASFGGDAPSRAGELGLLVENGVTWLARAVADESMGEGAPPLVQALMPADALRIRGRHNAKNALAALALATAIGLPLAPLLHALRDYRGEPHRVEPVGTVAGVEAFDDSKGTNVGATLAALEGLGDERAPGRLVVVLGGDGKGQDFAPLAPALQRWARAVVAIGRDAGAMLEVAARAGVPATRHATLEAATAAAFDVAERGDAVLLSPACASLDMFRNYAHRAEVFVRTVHGLAEERGA